MAETARNDVGGQKRSYRCYLLIQDRIVDVRIIEGADDATTLLEADRLLQASPCGALEIWRRQHKVSTLSKAP